ncbi:predicted protein [Nematostella vectensis]|uniref:RRM domain-containing protein n=1 Tax=Nematostella vectensis TaxID=45351 RepID=A7RRA7_NEMVE|nr:predicted protein [Nematostella vectensis]|eukprot:XP_001637979.1 predicted protein [Nematostella vectensis]
MATFGWSYNSNVSGAKPPKEQPRKLEEWQKERPVSGVPLHRQTHSTESIYAGMKRKRYNPRSKVFVGNLNRDTKPVTLAEYFSVFGEIEGLRIVKDHETGISRGFAFITFTEPESASKAIRWCKHHHPQLDGRQITISGAERRRKAEIPRSNKSRRTGQTLYWEYKWHDKPDAEVFGPYETSLMLEWSNAGFFNIGCWVRQADPHVEKYSEHTTDSEPSEENTEVVPAITAESSTISQSLVVSYSSSEEEDGEIESEDNSLNNSHSENDSKNRVSEKKYEEKTGENLVTETYQEQKSYQNSDYERQKSDRERTEAESSQITSRNTDESKETFAGSSRLPYDLSHSTAGSADLYAYACADPVDDNGYKAHDLLGRDSSSDEDEGFYAEDSRPLVANEFVHVHEVDFSIFP